MVFLLNLDTAIQLLQRNFLQILDLDMTSINLRISKARSILMNLIKILRTLISI